MEGAERKLPPPIRPPLAAQLGLGWASRRVRANTGTTSKLAQRRSRRGVERAKAL
jgi:hypothetical protein